jgi:hypothetical protein
MTAKRNIPVPFKPISPREWPFDPYRTFAGCT